MKFVHESRAQRVRFEAGGAPAGVAAEVEHLGASRVMLIVSERDHALAEQICARVPVVVRFEEIVMHVPVELQERARAAALDHDADVVVSVGGGSATGLAKAIALATDLPIVAVPTTYAGSEATPVWGLTADRVKTNGFDSRVLPRAVVYDATLVATLPSRLAVASGLNALAHCVDSLWAPTADPINGALALEGVRVLADALPVVKDDPSAIEGCEKMLYGAYLAGVAFSSAGTGLHHKICHVLGGSLGLPHAETHAVVLPHVLALNLPNAPEAAARLAEALGAPDALLGLRELRQRVDAPRALRDFGIREADLAGVVDAVMQAVPPSNPTPVTREMLAGLLSAAWLGSEPS